MVVTSWDLSPEGTLIWALVETFKAQKYEFIDKNLHCQSTLGPRGRLALYAFLFIMQGGLFFQ
jgi:hypothetical protein